jgi:hypothetical protein
LPCWFPIWCPTWKMFWYLLKHIYFIVHTNCILVCIIVWCCIWNFLKLSFSLSEYFWHCNFSAQVHCWKSVSVKYINFKMTVFWVIMLCYLVDSYRHFGGAYWPHLLLWIWRVAGSSETFVTDTNQEFI